MGKWLKRNEDDYVIMIDGSYNGSGYNVVPKSVDPYNAYDIDEVRQYCLDHPENEVVWDDESGKYVPKN
ncbi:hypothetical protein [uncultured Sphaerochaeta sp.]|uniref:hypothetical protein n=1 Tax=uncultured Sphaerochaeta sp. TaxID=886478 RepID=UPI0029CA31B4|nr:hypothetical protein [uncultured Sphaerochaeta sp.]